MFGAVSLSEKVLRQSQRCRVFGAAIAFMVNIHDRKSRIFMKFLIKLRQKSKVSIALFIIFPLQSNAVYVIIYLYTVKWFFALFRKKSHCKKHKEV